jgi:hypothetical protein
MMHDLPLGSLNAGIRVAPMLLAIPSSVRYMHQHVGKTHHMNKRERSDNVTCLGINGLKTSCAATQ